ncbi:hypothetical protein [Halocella sp. SP3-1]|uniref:hypothetical protein n=1 Tax=Halocella sp. SP3-1 TaxID=2382161 RepID=UPI00256FD102|nr:hypothetical protein [Halocella sp. SP3-1]
MSLLDFFRDLFKSNNKRNLMFIFIQDNKCGHKIKILLRKSYDISRVYNDKSVCFRVNKGVICNNCYHKINLRIDFDKRYNIVNQEIDGGKVISEEEYNSE